MIRNFAIFPIQPEKKEQAKEAMLKLSKASLNDTGCHAYDICDDLTGQGNMLYTMEKWESLELLDQHMKTAHIAAFDEVAGGFLAGAPEVTTLVEVE